VPVEPLFEKVQIQNKLSRERGRRGKGREGEGRKRDTIYKR